MHTLALSAQKPMRLPKGMLCSLKAACTAWNRKEEREICIYARPPIIQILP
jgi:hypothetical protein